MTGLTCDQVDRLVLDVCATGYLDPPAAASSVCAAPSSSCAVPAPQRSQALIAELFGCSQPTVPRLVARLMPVISTVLAANAERIATRDLKSTVRVDGFLVPTGNWRKGTFTSGMYSGKRHACGFNVQVIGSWRGTLVLTGKPMPGSMHDAKAWRESGLAGRMAGRLHADGGPGGYGDTAYTGTGLCIPDRRPKGQTLTESARDYNRMIALALTPESTVRKGIARARRMLHLSPDEVAYELGNGNLVTAQDTVPFTLWAAAKHLDDYAETIRTCVRVGGDIDTTAAIAGGIVASYTGVDGIPADWLSAREPLPTWLNEAA
jgi:ADP-ribosylglycohydrolase/DDE superfamily endonuclease